MFNPLKKAMILKQCSTKVAIWLVHPIDGSILVVFAGVIYQIEVKDKLGGT